MPVSAALPSRIALIGFMGSGKSTVGRILARSLGYGFVDLDSEIEKHEGMSIPRIFEERGEQAFRRREAEAVAALAGRTRIVIAAGGGAPLQEGNRRFFAEMCACFHLKVSLATALSRTGSGAGRPMLAGGEEAARALYSERLPRYRGLGTEPEATWTV